MLRIRRRFANDGRLASLVRTGDDDAFTVLRNRYRAAMLHYARRLLRGTGGDARVVVDDVLEQAHAELRPRGRRSMAVGAWLFSLTRNRAIDEVRRNEPEPEPDPEDPEDAPAKPSRRSLRGRKRLVAALSRLPANQVAALLGRELDHRSQTAIATELGVSETASRMLVVRARETLAGIPPTRAPICTNVRLALEDNHRRGARPTEQIREHLLTCDGCNDFRASLSRMDGRLSPLEPGVGSAVLAAEGRIVGGGSPAGVTAKAVAALAVLIAIIGGGVAIITHRSTPPQPQITLVGAPRVPHPVKPIPNGATLLRAVVRAPAGARDASSAVTVSCPAGTAFSSLTNNGPRKRPKLRATSDTKRGTRGDLHFTVIPATLPKASVITATILCTHVKATAATPNAGAGAREHVCVPQAIFITAPRGPYRSVGFKGDRVDVLRTSASKLYVQVRTTSGLVTWAQRAQVSSHGTCR